MALRLYTIKIGATRESVVEAAGSAIAGGEAISVNIDSTKSQSEVLRAIDLIRQHIISSKWPPA